MKKGEISYLDINMLNIYLEADSVGRKTVQRKYSEPFKVMGDFVLDSLKYAVGDSVEVEIVEMDKSPSVVKRKGKWYTKGAVVGIQKSKALIWIDAVKKYELLSVDK